MKWYSIHCDIHPDDFVFGQLPVQDGSPGIILIDFETCARVGEVQEGKVELRGDA